VAAQVHAAENGMFPTSTIEANLACFVLWQFARIVALTLSDPFRENNAQRSSASSFTLWFVFWLQKKDRGDLQDETRREQPSLPLTVYLEASLRTYQQI
jgi:hypothetical protein